MSQDKSQYESQQSFQDKSRPSSVESISSDIQYQDKKKQGDDSYKAFILPQYQSLCDESFLQNNMHSHHTISTTKDKLSKINQMISQSQYQTLSQHEYNDEDIKRYQQLKNENTINWLKKRYLQCGNKKYFGDQEDVAQQLFINSIYDNISTYLKKQNANNISSSNNSGIQLNEFNKLIQSFELPLSYQTLTKIYAIVDQDRDSHLNQYEFTNLLLSDVANKIYLSQFKEKQQSSSSNFPHQKHGSIQMAFRPASLSTPFRPTSLSSLCLFISFRINHDFLAEYLYDSNFQVKDKSIGLLKMLELIKVQGQSRIKNEFDKRIIRKLKIDKTDHLRVASPSHNNIQNKIKKLQIQSDLDFDIDSEEDQRVDSLDKQKEEKKIQLKENQNEISENNLKSDQIEKAVEKKQNSEQGRDHLLKKEKISKTGQDGSQKFLVVSLEQKNKNSNDQEIESSDQQSQQNYCLPQIDKKRYYNSGRYKGIGIEVNGHQNHFQKQMEKIVQKASQQGEMYGRNSFQQNKETIKELQQESILSKSQFDQSVSIKQSFQKSSQLSLPAISPSHSTANLIRVGNNHSVQNVQEINQFHTLKQDKIMSQLRQLGVAKVIDNSHTLSMMQEINNNIRSNSHNFKNINLSHSLNNNAFELKPTNDFTSSFKSKGYSKQMAQLMEKTINQAKNSPQQQSAKKIIQVEDSPNIKIYRKKMDNIKQKTAQRTNFLSEQLVSSNKNREHSIDS